MTDSRRTKSSLDRKSVNEFFDFWKDQPVSPQVAAREILRMRRSLRRAGKAFQRLGHGAVALSGFTFVAFLAALFDSKLSLLSGFITVTAALFLALVGYLFHMQADSIDLGDQNDY